MVKLEQDSTHPERPEGQNHGWVDLVDRKKITSTPRSIERPDGREIVRWVPAYIYDARLLQLSPGAFSTLHDFLNLGFPLEIQGWTVRDDEENNLALPTDSVPGEVITLATQKSKRVGKPRLSTVSFDGGTGRLIIWLNFKGMGDYLEKTLVNGRSHPDYARHYGDLVNEAIYKSLARLVTVNLFSQFETMPHVLRGEFVNTTLALLPSLIGVLGIVGHLAAPDAVGMNESQSDLLLLCLFSFVFLWVILQVSELT